MFAVNTNCFLELYRNHEYLSSLESVDNCTNILYWRTNYQCGELKIILLKKNNFYSETIHTHMRHIFSPCFVFCFSNDNVVLLYHPQHKRVDFAYPSVSLDCSIFFAPRNQLRQGLEIMFLHGYSFIGRDVICQTKTVLCQTCLTNFRKRLWWNDWIY